MTTEEHSAPLRERPLSWVPGEMLVGVQVDLPPGTELNAAPRAGGRGDVADLGVPSVPVRLSWHS